MSMPSATLDSAPVVGTTRRLTRVLVRVARDPFTSNGLLSLVDQAVVSGTSFATSVIIGRLCSRRELGLYALALSIVFIVRGVQDQLIFTPYTVYCSRRRGRSLAAYTGSILVHQALLSLLALAALAGLAGLGRWGLLQPELRLAIWALMGALPLLMARETMRMASFAHLELRTVIGLDLAVAVLQVGGLLALGGMHRLSVVSAYVVLGLASAAAFAGWCVLRRRQVRIRRRRVLADWRQNWFLARWALAAMIVSLAAPHAPAWLLARGPDGPAAVGVLAACAGLVGLAQMVLMGVGRSLTPQTARAYTHGGVRQLRPILLKSLLLFTAAIGAFCLLFLLAGGWLLTLVYGEKYAGYGSVVGVLGLSVLAHAFGTVAGTGLWTMERPRAHFNADLGMLLTTVAAALALIPTWGPLGAAVATLAGAVAGAVIRGSALLRVMAEAES